MIALVWFVVRGQGNTLLFAVMLGQTNMLFCHVLTYKYVVVSHLDRQTKFVAVVSRDWTYETRCRSVT